jgi:F-type H+-transporting ATPase subunit gamma
VTERLSDVEARIGSVSQLSAVIGAMRGIAAVRARDARGRLDGIRAYAHTIAGAISQALTLLPAPPGQAVPARAGHAVIALCAEQGFAGAFNNRLLDAAEREIAATGTQAQLMLLGTRGLVTASERGVAVAWSAPMATNAGQVPVLANRIVDALYERLDDGRVAHVTVVHAQPGANVVEVVARRLVPFDFTRFPPRASAIPPLLTLPAPVLLARIAAEYIFAELCEAVMLSYAAENEARMRAMVTARANVAKTLDELNAHARQLRQEEITSEIIELAAGAAASR